MSSGHSGTREEWEESRGLVMEAVHGPGTFLDVIQRIDLLMRQHPVVGHHLLDALVRTAREGAFFGNRILCLARSDDSDLVITPIGARHVPWNDAEWLDSKRHPEA